ncbi:acyclic terpene utilization AtuA family protein [Fusobacterium sp. PH5-44]|uniref:acyclic terpene utilization AtuA family protein n=1 Tax=unclassified Fusobacterium TaxID=2648384 RepID=UPI003D1EADD5
MKKIRIGSGAGYAGDRIEPAVDLMINGNIDYLVFECLAERTIAIAQQEKMKDPNKGYNGLLEYRFEKILPFCKEKKVKIITNMGAANPLSAVKKIKEMCNNIGITGLKLAAVLGDDISNELDKYLDRDVLELGIPLGKIKDKLVSANVYLGVDGIVEALKNGADIVITGRCADPAIFMGPMIYEFGWDVNNYDLIGKGIMTGHLLECGAQVSGGYFAVPKYNDVEELWNVGFPIAEVSENGDVIITKTETTGGVVSSRTCKEQLLYEIHDPANYMTPDGVADFTNISMDELGKNMVFLTGATGKEKPETLKVSIGYKDCFIGEGEISYGGSTAYDKAVLAGEVVRKRLEHTGVKYEELKIDIMGVNSLYGESIGKNILNNGLLGEVRLRVAGRTLDRANATKIANELETLYTNGPSGGGGVTKGVSEIVSICSIFVPRTDVKIEVRYEEV